MLVVVSEFTGAPRHKSAMLRTIIKTVLVVILLIIVTVDPYIFDGVVELEQIEQACQMLLLSLMGIPYLVG